MEETVNLDLSDMPKKELIYRHSNNFHYKTCSIEVYTNKGKKLNTYDTVMEASRDTGISWDIINKCLHYNYDIGDLVFTFEGSTFEDKVKVMKDTLYIKEYTLDGIPIRTWQSPSEAAKAYNLKSNDILRCLKSERLTVGGKIFLLPDHNIKARLYRLNFKSKRKK